MQYRCFLSAFVLIMAVALPLQSAGAGDLEAGARQVITDVSESAVIQLTDPAISRDERKQRMRQMMDEFFFVEGIAQWVLGRHWRKATNDERSEYLALYQDLMIETYVDRFASYDGETIEVTSVEVRNGKDAIVSSMVERPGTGEPIAVGWRVREFDGAFKIIDIMIEGVSMGQAQRSEFSSAIKSNDGDLAAFLDTLRERVETASSAGAQAVAN